MRAWRWVGGAVCLAACNSPSASTNEASDASVREAHEGEVHSASGSLELSRAIAVAKHDAHLTALLEKGRGDLLHRDGALVSSGARLADDHDFSALGAQVPVVANGARTVGVSRIERLTLRVRPTGASAAPARLEDGHAVFQDAWPSTDLTIATTRDIYEELLVLRDERAPSQFEWQLDVPSGLSAMPEPSGSIAFVDGKGDARLRIPKPYAVDALGTKRDAKLTLEDGRLVVSLDRAGLAYPVLLDPAIETAVWVLRQNASGQDTFYGDKGSCPTCPNGAGVSGAAMAWSTSLTKIITIGGDTGNPSFGTAVNNWKTWDSVQGAWLVGPGSFAPPATTGGRTRVAMTTGVAPNVYVFGGLAGLGANTPLGDAYRHDGSNWFKICDTCLTGTTATARWGSMFGYVGGTFVLFGGSNAGTSAQAVGDTCTGTTWPLACSTPATSPSQRAWGAYAVDTTRGKLVVFGGFDNWKPSLADTWEWSPSTGWVAKCGTGALPDCGPAARIASAMTYDSARQRMVLFSGSPNTTDTWEYDPAAGTWAGRCGTPGTPVCGPAGRDSLAMAFDPVRGRTVMAGGFAGGLYQTNTWEYHAHGGGCSKDADCDTGFCREIDPVSKVGVCCEQSLCGTCQACNLPSSPGVCANVAKGVDDPDSCNPATSTCDGAGGCNLSKNGQSCSGGSTCTSGFCANGFCCDSACNKPCQVCSKSLGATANGTCTTAPASYAGTPVCPTALCNGTIADCPGGCSFDTDCPSGKYCASDGTCKAQKAQGTSCSLTGDCKGGSCRVCAPVGGASAGFCVDGTCCNTPCNGTCQACNVAGKVGTCSNVGVGVDDPDTCAPTATSTCDGSGVCKVRTGQSCEPSLTKCLSGNCSDGFCCDKACNGACDFCSKTAGATANGTCTNVAGSTGAPSCGGLLCKAASSSCPTGCSNDADCDTAFYCSKAGTCVARKAQGATCDATADCKVAGCHSCITGNCVDGVCCDTPCTGICNSCTAAKKESKKDDGVCGPTADGGTDRSGTCKDSGTTGTAGCKNDGLCNGTGGCRLYSKTTSCGGGSVACVDNKATGRFCDGTGSCLASGSTVDCSPFKCIDGTGCPDKCATSADCLSTAYCDGSVCKEKLDLGKACTAKEQCTSNICVDGVCCNAPCGGQCEACNVAGGEGSCVPVPGNPVGSRPACKAATSPGDCSAAQCDGITRDSCTGFVGPSTPCRADSCTAGVETLPAKCDGKGTCPPVETKTCEPFACGDTSCKTTCAADPDCASGYHCDATTGKCVTQSKCDGDHTLTSADGKTTSDCSPFKCDSSGTCKTTCGSTDDCVAGLICDGTHCIAPSGGGDTGSSSGCSVGRTGSPSAALLMALAGLGWVAARRRRGREHF